MLQQPVSTVYMYLLARSTGWLTRAHLLCCRAPHHAHRLLDFSHGMQGATWEDIKRTQAHLYTAEPPTRDADGFFVFADAPDFRPNLAPFEVLQRGSFGGGYYRTISSAATGMVHKNAHLEFPKGWFDGIQVQTLVTSNVYVAYFVHLVVCAPHPASANTHRAKKVCTAPRMQLHPLV